MARLIPQSGSFDGGEVTITGQTSWAGAILAVGDGSVIRNGAGNGEVSGGIIVADIAVSTLESSSLRSL